VTRRSAGQINADNVTRCGIYSWTTRDDSNRAAISRYGRKDAQITSVPLPPARSFHRVVDTESIKAITDEIGQLKRDMRDMEGPLGEKKKKLEEVKDAGRALQDRMVCFPMTGLRSGLTSQEKVQAEIKEVRDKLVKFKRAHRDIGKCLDRLDRASQRRGRWC
jgi:chromosome segregation ATPase